MSNACKNFRSQWLERDEHAADTGAAEHSESCEACRRWVRSTVAQIDLLRSLPRRALPEGVELSVSLETEPEPSFFEELLSSLPRRKAPAELEERVMSDLRAAEPFKGRHADSTAWVSTLSFPQVPSVLDRLVSEELASPQVHRIERFVGGLERLSAPAELQNRVAASLKRQRNWKILAPLIASAAAAFLLWTLTPWDRPGGVVPEKSYSFDVVQAESLDGLQPIAAGLVGVWDPTAAVELSRLARQGGGGR